MLPLAVAAVLTPFRDSFPGTDAALVLVAAVVAVAANGHRGAGLLAPQAPRSGSTSSSPSRTGNSPSTSARTSKPRFCCSSWAPPSANSPQGGADTGWSP
ncbi:hypothetical protein ACU686_03810 [Yinghuangia aomiensis]